MTRALVLVGLIFAGLALGSCRSDTMPHPARELHNVNSLFVGIDDYRFSREKDPNSVFSDLKGATGDVARFKQALGEIYGLDLDRHGNGACDSSNTISRTLTNVCATREQILAALDAQIDALQPGDTLLFYFAGHGSRYRDDEAFDQDSGYNGTILPHDARNPDGSPGDIFDIELKQRKDRANAAGINFVSIFDSCNSATATRDGASGQARSVAALAGSMPENMPRASLSSSDVGIDAGYWVHLAAAQDGEEAQETNSGAVGSRAGVFTSALIDTLGLPGMAEATFGDIIREVQLSVAQKGNVAQNPSAEGRLTASLGAKARAAKLFDAEFDGDTITLNSGSISGITVGSAFAFHANQKDAVSDKSPLATGTVTSVAENSAQIAVVDKSETALPERLVAEETAHFFPADFISITNDLPEGKARNAVNRMLAETGFVKVAPDGVAHIAEIDGGGLVLRASDGTLLADGLGNAGDPAFQPRLEVELRKLARVQQLLALRTSIREGMDDITFCIAPDGYRPTACPALEKGGVRQLGENGRVTATLVNRSDKPRHIYLLAIDPRNAIDLILPKPDEFDQKVAPGQPYRRGPFSFDLPGTYRFLTIATDTPIRADAFAQAGNGVRDIGACVSPLERLLCAASRGTRDAGVTSVGNWSASVASAIVVDGDITPR
ncbi:MAG: caspase family protein [Parasphingorhabdus sp.]